MKKLLLACTLLVSALGASAAGTWLLVTDTGVKVPVAEVGMLVAADDAATFAVVRTAGEPIEGVASVSFTFTDVTAVDKVDASGIALLSNPVSSTLSVFGCEGRKYAVVDMAGRSHAAGTIASASEKIDVAALAPGMYILTVEGATLKFIKK